MSTLRLNNNLINILTATVGVQHAPRARKNVARHHTHGERRSMPTEDTSGSTAIASQIPSLHVPIMTYVRSLDRHTLDGNGAAPHALALSSGLRHVVEHHSKHAPAPLLDRQGRLTQVLRAGATSARHENDASGMSSQDHSVSESEDWRSINDDQPVCCQLTQQIAHHGGPQQLGGIRRRSTCRQNLQTLDRPLDQSLTEVRRASQNVGEPGTAL